jgi:hypothetical protein
VTSRPSCIVNRKSNDNLYSVSRRKPDLPADIEDVSEINVPLLLHVLCTETMKLVNMGAWSLRSRVLVLSNREAPCVCSGAASIVGLPSEVFMLKHGVAQYQMWRDCCSASSAIVFCFTGSAIAHSQTQLKCASYLVVHAAIKLRYVIFRKTDFSVTEFLRGNYFLVYFFTFMKGWRVSRRVISEEPAACVLKNAGSEFALKVGIQPSELKYVINQNTLCFLCFVFICSFFVFFLFISFLFILNRNVIFDFSNGYLLSYIKVEQFKNNCMCVSAWLPWDRTFGHM